MTPEQDSEEEEEEKKKTSEREHRREGLHQLKQDDVVPSDKIKNPKRFVLSLSSLYNSGL
jgi:hypothetical protein